MTHHKIYSVSELNQIARGLLENRLFDIQISGEITNLVKPDSGHLYFTLKDARAQIKCAMFRNANLFLRFKPENGAAIVARGKVSLYEARGDYQFIAEEMQPAGTGALQLEFEALKQRLWQEGLFSDTLKKPLPEFPQKIAIVTSATGAAIRDVLQVLERRYPLAAIMLYPTPVQGEDAAGKIVNALQAADSHPDNDVILLCRGGGSIEDLWSFNEETVARAIYHCTTPVVVGVGHEIDFTIADFAADVRAPTPSAAAELVSPDQQTLKHRLQQITTLLERHLSDGISRRKSQLESLLRQLDSPHFSRPLHHQAQRIDELTLQLTSNYKHRYTHQQQRYQHSHQRLINANPVVLLQHQHKRFQQLTQRLATLATSLNQPRQTRLKQLDHALKLLGPTATLNRGYAIITQPETHKIVRDASTLHTGDKISCQIANGTFSATVHASKPS